MIEIGSQRKCTKCKIPFTQQTGNSLNENCWGMWFDQAGRCEPCAKIGVKIDEAGHVVKPKKWNELTDAEKKERVDRLRAGKLAKKAEKLAEVAKVTNHVVDLTKRRGRKKIKS